MVENRVSTVFRLVVLFVCFAASAANADHGIFNATASSASANTVLQLEQQVGRYEVGDDFGQFSMSYLQIEFALLNQLSVTAGLPWVTVMPSNSSGVAGLGDSMTGLKYQLTAPTSQGVATSIGLNLELPTGDVGKRIGGDHYGVEGVFAIAADLSSKLKIISRLSHSFAPDHNHGHEHGNGHDHGDHHDHQHSGQAQGGVIRPHGAQESTALVSLVYATEMQFVETAIRGGMAFDHDEYYAAPLDLILRAGFNIGRQTTVVSSLSQTVAGALRTPWTFSLGLTVNYERHTHTHGEEPNQAQHEHHEHEEAKGHHDDHDDHDHHDHHDHGEHDHPHAND